MDWMIGLSVKCATKDPFLQEKTRPPKFAFEDLSKNCLENLRNYIYIIIYIYIYIFDGEISAVLPICPKTTSLILFAQQFILVMPRMALMLG